MLKRLARHVTAFLASFAIAYSAVLTFWLLPFVLSIPDTQGVRGHMLRYAVTHPLSQGVLAAAGCVLALLPFRRRLRSWKVISLLRTALVGGLAGAMWSPATHVMYWLSRTIDVPVGTKGYFAFPIVCGVVSAYALYFPWLTSDAPSTLSSNNAHGQADELSTGPQPLMPILRKREIVS